MKTMTWDIWHEEEKSKPYYKKLMNTIMEDYQSGRVYPKKEELFSAFHYTPFETVKVVIIGQDPYHNEGEAHGLAFSCKTSLYPPSLLNIMKEVENEFGMKMKTGDLTFWAKQGVFLLNTALSVKKNQPRSHKGIGWETYTLSAIESISAVKEHVVFMLWGKNAQMVKSKIDESKHLVLMTSHPSPLSSYRGFLGCNHFKMANEFLQNKGQEPIIWVE